MADLIPRITHRADQLHRTAKSYLNQAGTNISTYIRNANFEPKAFIYAALLLVAFTYLATKLTKTILSRRSSPAPSTPTLEKRSPLKAPERPPGVWPPSAFLRPRASPYPNWSVTHTKPLSYRPFRYGPKYNITMGLRNMHWDEWIELDNEFLSYHKLKCERLAERQDKIVKIDARGEKAAWECVREVGGYLAERYPSLYQQLEGGGKGVRNLATGDVFVLEEGGGRNPMEMLARMIQDDIAIMLEREDGEYYLAAGAICLAGFWRLEDKFGMGLSEIHTSGDVPGFKDKLEKGMKNFFRRLQPEKPVLRNNYFIQVDDKLAWSESIGSEDSEGIGWFTAEKNKAIAHHFFRSERQSLRRLPLTGAVVFTIRTYFLPVTEICKEPGVPGRLASAVRSWGDDVSRYKGKEMYGDVLLEYLDAEHEGQVRAGLVGEREEERGGRYPF
ncbi:hypothetical protein HBI95_133100 [Parastagonospora nodorum]|nr:hypothetical protein HBI95_133100 [Parastagonospora nodorum]KAH5890394.1 hypothetical protein HBI89_234390 [Parastagonospora nodorum]